MSFYRLILRNNVNAVADTRILVTFSGICDKINSPIMSRNKNDRSTFRRHISTHIWSVKALGRLRINTQTAVAISP